MSDRPKFPRADALKVAEELIAALNPFVTRIEVVGSVRRKRAMVSDVELLFIPRIETVQTGFFDTDTARENTADSELGRMLRRHTLGKRPNKDGAFTWGEKNKLAVHVATGIPVDLFSVMPAENWWVSLVVRTGSKETNLRLTNGAIARRGTLNAYGSGVTWRESGRISVATSEKGVFEMCGVPYLQPEERG